MAHEGLLAPVNDRLLPTRIEISSLNYVFQSQDDKMIKMYARLCLGNELRPASSWAPIPQEKLKIFLFSIQLQFRKITLKSFKVD